MELSDASRETVLRQQQENRPILKLAANAIINRLTKGRHVIAENPLKSEAYDQDEMAALKPYFDDGRLMKVSGSGCDVGYRDESCYPYMQRFCIVTDMPAVANAVDNTRCNHPGIPHSPHQLLGSSRTRAAAEWPHEFVMMILDAIQQQILIDEETIYNVFACPAGLDDDPTIPEEDLTQQAKRIRRRHAAPYLRRRGQRGRARGRRREGEARR